MISIEKKRWIKISKNGPYLVYGNIPLAEKIIVPKGRTYEFKEGRALPQSDEYALCRCGQSQNMPFCDGAHSKAGFKGEETASKDKYEKRAEFIEGPGIDLMDDDRCAFARFCHREKGNVWDLTEDSDNEEIINEAIEAACNCPTGRLVAVAKNGKSYEPVYMPSIDIIQDPEQGVSGGIFVKGNIPIEASDGIIYEIRNRLVLCRCGRSANKPFCDAMHIPIKFKDNR